MPSPSRASRQRGCTLSLILALLLAGCSGAAQPQTATGSDAATPRGTPASPEGASSVQTRTVEDATGIVEVPADPERPVPLDGVFAGDMLTLGVEPVAVPSDVKLQLASIQGLLPDGAFDGYRAFVEDEVEGLPEVGLQYEIDLEALAAADPDLIIASEFEAADVTDTYRQIAPTYFARWPHNGAWRTRFMGVAEALGRQDEGQAVSDAFDAVVADLPEEVTSQTVAFVRASARNDIRADILETSFPGSVAREAGIPVLDLSDDVDIADDASWIDLSEEALDLLTDADVIVISDLGFYDPTLQPTDEVLAGSPLWDALPAVRDGRVVLVPGPVYNGGHYAAATALVSTIAEAVAQP
jgi:iron complex transport system substrate-binding protein